jgi:hypothetical protein
MPELESEQEGQPVRQRQHEQVDDDLEAAGEGSETWLREREAW